MRSSIFSDACGSCVVLLLLLQAAADVLALASLEVDLSGIEEGQTVTVKWRGKPVFIRHRTPEEIAEATETDLAGFRDPQTDAERVLDPKVRFRFWALELIGCTSLGGYGPKFAVFNKISK
jgi:ubiquinol-cytochrome c reductase iron-sulfur subunit